VIIAIASKIVIDLYEIHQVGDATHTGWWIPAEDLELLNAELVGLIQVIAKYHEGRPGKG